VAEGVGIQLGHSARGIQRSWPRGAYPRRCYWPRHRSKAKEDLSWPKPSYSYLVPTLEERPAERKVVSSSVCLDIGTKLHLVPTPEERLAGSCVVSSPVCLNTKSNSPYLLHLVPTPEERPTRKQYRFVLGVSKTPRWSVYLVPTPEERPVKSSVVSSPVCLKHQDDQGLGVYAQGERFPKDSASPIWCVSAPRHLALHCSELPFCLMPMLEKDAPRRFLARCLNIRATGGLSLTPGEETSRRNPLTPAQGQDARILTGLSLPFALDAHARRVRPLPPPFGVSKRSRRFARLVPTPGGDICVTPAEVSKHQGDGFVSY